MPTIRMSRRQVLGRTLATGAAAATLFLPAFSRAGSRPQITHGLQSGDVTRDGAMIWARADRPSEMAVEVATTESFRDARRLPALAIGEATDNMGKMLLRGLPSDQQVFYRVTMTDLTDRNAVSQPVTGSFRTAPTTARSVSFVWSGDTVGQGWGIDAGRGGMRTYRTMLEQAPDFFIHSGDTIYADGPLSETKEMPDGGIWRNLVTPEKAKVAETLHEFRHNWLYNMLDENVRAFNAQVPMFVQWDDHETVDNWYPWEILDDERYTVKNVSLLTERSKRGFLETTPIRTTLVEPGRIYRKASYGPLLDIFFIDMRTYRGPNTTNDQAEPGADTAILGRAQIDWLKRSLATSRATWKVIASDMPIGLAVRDGKTHFEAVAQGRPERLGREFDIAEVLSAIKALGVLNVVWLTADVHYTAAHHYSPDRATFQDFEPFWEFVSGPLHAGTFGAPDLDTTFGPKVEFVKAPPAGQANLPPSAGLQFFGKVDIEGGTGAMTVSLMDVGGSVLWSTLIEPAA
jgi:alkaline phosphatase D